MAEKSAKKLFDYKGTDARGNKVEGTVEGINPDLIKAQLRQKGIKPIVVKAQAKPLFGGGEKAGKVTAADIAIFARQLTTMMVAGVPLVQAMDIVAGGAENIALQKLVYALKRDVEGGASLAQALAKHPDHFDDLFVNLVEAGEQSGTLEDLLNKVATYKEKTEAIKKKVKKALAYPIAVMIVAFIVTVILLVYVVPQFESMFNNFGGELPAFTKMVVNMSEWMQANWYMLIVYIGVAVFGFIQAKQRIPGFDKYMDRFALKAPIFGNITEKSILARFSRTLSTMFAAGVPLVEAMDSVAGAANNSVFYDATIKIRDDISAGDQLNASMKRTGLFPSMILQMVAIGEESGSVDQMLGKVADFYEEEVDNAVDALSSLMEPLIMAVLGVLIGGLVIAMYLPIFKWWLYLMQTLEILYYGFQQNPLIFCGFIFVLGALVGSFLNVVIYRLPIMMEREFKESCSEYFEDLCPVNNQNDQEKFNLVVPRSKCPKCGHQIKSWENIPLISYLFMRGKCTNCGTKISLQYPFVELVTALLSVAIAHKFGVTWQCAAALFLTWSLVALTGIDIKKQLLPDVITLPLMWFGLLISSFTLFIDTGTALWGAAIGYLSLWSVYWIFKLATGKEGMGYGDFKLLAALGAWMGHLAFLLSLFFQLSLAASSVYS